MRKLGIGGGLATVLWVAVLAVVALPALAAAPPVIESESASGVTPFAATLEAQVNPEGEATSCEFQYGKTNTYGTSVPCEPATLEGSESERAALPVTGLEAATTYHFRVVVENAAKEKVEGPDAEFTTSTLIAPEVLSETATNLKSSEPELEARINPEYQETSYKFEYSTSKTLVEEGKGSVIDGAAELPAVSEEALAGPVKLSGVQAGPVYYYRVVATNATGTSEGAVQEFQTLAKPLVGAGGPGEVTEATAVVSGSVTPQGLYTTYRFLYLDQEAYEKGIVETPAEPYTFAKRGELASLTGIHGETLTDYTAHPVQTVLRELTPGTTYHYALIAENELGRIVGADDAFTTAGTAPVEPGPQAEIPGPAPQASPFAAATTIPFAPYTSIAALDAQEAKEGKAITPVTKSLTRAQKLSKALKACERKPKSKRAGCETTARHRYGPAGAKKRKKK